MTPSVSFSLNPPLFDSLRVRVFLSVCVCARLCFSICLSTCVRAPARARVCVFLSVCDAHTTTLPVH